MIAHETLISNCMTDFRDEPTATVSYLLNPKLIKESECYAAD